MQSIVTFWCGLVGINDPLCVQIATGIAGGSTLIYAPFFAWWMLRLAHHKLLTQMPVANRASR